LRWLNLIFPWMKGNFRMIVGAKNPRHAKKILKGRKMYILLKSKG